MEFDWIGIPAQMDPSGVDSLGFDDGTETEKSVYDEVGGTKTVERRRSDWMPSDRNGKRSL